MYLIHVAKRVVIDWAPGMSTQLVQAKVDQSGFGSVVFKWTGMHNVWLFKDKAAFDSCDFARADGLSDDSGYVFTSRADTYYFACSIYGHCANGQKLQLDITDGTAKTGSCMSGQACSCAQARI